LGWLLGRELAGIDMAQLSGGQGPPDEPADRAGESSTESRLPATGTSAIHGLDAVVHARTDASAVEAFSGEYAPTEALLRNIERPIDARGLHRKLGLTRTSCSSPPPTSRIKRRTRSTF
jgi:hypothetical protein